MQALIGYFENKLSRSFSVVTLLSLPAKFSFILYLFSWRPLFDLLGKIVEFWAFFLLSSIFPAFFAFFFFVEFFSGLWVSFKCVSKMPLISPWWVGQLHDDVILLQLPDCPWVCRFLVQIKSIVLHSSAGLTNLNNKAKPNSGSCSQSLSCNCPIDESCLLHAQFRLQTKRNDLLGHNCQKCYLCVHGRKPLVNRMTNFARRIYFYMYCEWYFSVLMLISFYFKCGRKLLPLI